MLILVLNHMNDSVRICFPMLWFYITIASLSDWLKNLAVPYDPIRRKTKTNSDSLTHFSCASYQLHLFTLSFIGSLDCLCPLRLTIVITLVFDLQHSIENRSIEKP